MKILHIDIETAPMLAAIWSLRSDYVPINHIIEPGYTMCWAAKWHGKKEVIFDSIYHSSKRKMIKHVYDLLSEADSVCHYNGTKFDIPMLQQEFLLQKLKPIEYFQIDLLKVVRKKFKFHSNKLDYVSQQLGLGSKVKHMGMDLWRGCMNKDLKCWDVMKKYNKQDVILLESLYNKLLPWIDSHPNHGLYIDSNEMICRNCGSKSLKKDGKRYTTTGVYQRYRCNNCGRVGRSRNQIEKYDGVTV